MSSPRGPCFPREPGSSTPSPPSSKSWPTSARGNGAPHLPLGRVIEYLEHHPPRWAEIALGLRNLVLAAAAHATETIHWRTLSYHDAGCGGRVKGAICQISVHEDHVRLSFIHGARLPDPSGLLMGDRKSKRFIRFTVWRRSEASALARLVRAAAKCVAKR